MRYKICFILVSILTFSLAAVPFALAEDMPPADAASITATGMPSAVEAIPDSLPDTSAVSSAFGITPLFFDVCWAGVFCGNFGHLGKRMNMLTLFLAPALFLCIFIIGAFIFTISAGRDQWVQTGKNMMKGSLLGLVVVIIAYSVWRMTIWVLYGGFT